MDNYAKFTNRDCNAYSTFYVQFPFSLFCAFEKEHFTFSCLAVIGSHIALCRFGLKKTSISRKTNRNSDSKLNISWLILSSKKIVYFIEQ